MAPGVCGLLGLYLPWEKRVLSGCITDIFYSLKNTLL